ncbi:MAG: threonylcarbamoyl-AMP synthase [Bacteroidia bacterium]|nr:threonylcarbamoyl-AMP synthase [Bacteroidia bacterium]NNJ56789.1 threonylcarbamoyl-AMP synthase [Bacteroidia bacterium]
MIGTDVSVAARLLSEGEVVAIPTETVYGLAANALNPEAIAKIYSVKNRPTFNPLILHVKSIDEAKKYVKNFNTTAQCLAEKFWPGPLSILLQKNNLVPDVVTAGLPNVVLRVPKNTKSLELLNALNFPLAAPSANISNTVSPTSAQRVEQNLGNRIPYILDGGPAEVGLESTIVSLLNDEVVILREGGITKEELEEVLGMTVTYSSSKEISSPGQLKKHYATHKPLYIVKDLEKALQDFKNKKVSALLFTENDSLDCFNTYQLSRNNNLSEAANNLFEMMNRADEDDSDVILVEEAKNTGIGRAINDRLRRASID